MSLTEFLTARIAEDQAVVLAVMSDAVFREDGSGDLSIVDCTDQYLADYDPVRVLAECEAKRRIVGLHPAHESSRPRSALELLREASAPREASFVVFCETCGDPYIWDQTPPVEWPCPTLRALALPYADHADFDPAWRQ